MMCHFSSQLFLRFMCKMFHVCIDEHYVFNAHNMYTTLGTHTYKNVQKDIVLIHE